MAAIYKFITIILFSLTLLAQEFKNEDEYQKFLIDNFAEIYSKEANIDQNYIVNFIKILESKNDPDIQVKILQDFIGDEKVAQRAVFEILKRYKSNPSSLRKIVKSLERINKSKFTNKFKTSIPIRCTSALLVYIATRDTIHSYASSFVNLNDQYGQHYKKYTGITQHLLNAFVAVGCISDIIQTQKEISVWYQLKKENVASKKIANEILNELNAMDDETKLKLRLEEEIQFVKKRNNLKVKIMADLLIDSDKHSISKDKINKTVNSINSDDILKTYNKVFLNMTEIEKSKLIRILKKEGLSKEKIEAIKKVQDSLIQIMENDLLYGLKKGNIDYYEYMRSSFDLEKAQVENILNMRRPSLLTNLCFSGIALSMSYVGMGAALGRNSSDLDDIGEDVFRKNFHESIPYAISLITPCLAQTIFAPITIIKNAKKISIINTTFHDYSKLREILNNRQKLYSNDYQMYEIGDSLEEFLEKIRLEDISEKLIYPNQITFTSSCIKKLLLKRDDIFLTLNQKKTNFRKVANTEKLSCIKEINSLLDAVKNGPYHSIIKNRSIYLTREKKSGLVELMNRVNQSNERSLSVDEMSDKIDDLLRGCD